MQSTQRKQRKDVAWVLRTLLWIALLAAAWYAITPKHKGQSISPRNVYRVEYYDASPLQRLIHYKMKIPSFVRLYRIQPEILLGESDVVDLWLNGELYWCFDSPLNVVRVGRDVVFNNIPPECSNCPPLPKSALMP